MSIEIISTLDWPSTTDDNRITNIQCCGEHFLDYEVRRLEYRLFRHGSSFNLEEESKEEEEVTPGKKERNLLKYNGKKLEKLTYYQVLGDIPMYSTPEQIKRSYHKACLKYHPDKTGRGEEDEVFLKVKAAFDTLSDVSKRKSYDSAVEFNEWIPTGREIFEETKEFYDVYGPVFERNLRFDSRYDPEKLAKVNSSANLQSLASPNKKNKKNKKKQAQQQNSEEKKKEIEKPPTLGNDDTPIQKVNDFYEYWVHFESWRDFSLVASKEVEGDVESADSRYEKRYIQKEIERGSKKLKQKEMERINTLVERAMANDPRLKKQKLLEKEEKLRKEKEKALKEEQERLAKQQEEERLEKERVEREKQEKEEKQNSKAKKDKEKKILRKCKNLLRKLTLAAYDSSGEAEKALWNSDLHELNDDIELLCSELDAVQITTLTDTLGGQDAVDNSSANIEALHEIKLVAQETKSGKLQESLDAIKKRDELRKEAAMKEKLAKQKSASLPWIQDELTALAKGVKKYPPGGANRWETIALFVNNMCKQDTPRTREECIEKYNHIISQQGSSGGGGAAAATDNKDTATENENEDNAKKQASSQKEDNGGWTDEQDKQLQDGLSKYPSSMDKNERWSSISKGVDGKNKKECVERFKIIRNALKSKSRKK